MDEFLASMGITPQEPPESSQSLLGDAEPTVTVPEPQQVPHELTASEFNDILDDLGFNPPDAEAEELVDDEVEELIEPNGVDSLVESAVLDELSDAQMETVRVMVDAADGVVDTVLRESPDEEPSIRIGRGILDQIGPAPRISVTADINEEGEVSIAATIQEEPPPSIHNEPAETNLSAAPLIPENSPTLTMDVATSRFSGAEWYELAKQQRIIIGGCGGIGSNLCYQMSRLSPSQIVIYDDDTVELGNMSGQLFSRQDVGDTKVSAIRRMIESYSETHCVYAIERRFDAATDSHRIMMCGFDNMEARKTFFNAWMNHVASVSPERRNECLYLDGITKCLIDYL